MSSSDFMRLSYKIYPPYILAKQFKMLDLQHHQVCLTLWATLDGFKDHEHHQPAGFIIINMITSYNIRTPTNRTSVDDNYSSVHDVQGYDWINFRLEPSSLSMMSSAIN